MADLTPGRKLNEFDFKPSANAAEMYGEEGGEPYRIKVGEPNGLPFLDADGSVPLEQIPEEIGNYTPPSTGTPGTVRAFLDLLWSTGASAGAALIRFIQAGTGAVARTLQSKARDTVSVKDFGAVGDGVADDTAAFQAAIASVSLAQSVRGAKISVPRGHYKLTDTLTLTSYATDNAINIEFLGDGWLSTWLDFSAMTGAKDGIYVPNDQQVTIAGFYIKGSNSANTRDGIRFGSTAGGGNAVSIFDIRDVRVQAWGRDGFSHYNSYMGSMSRCYAIANLRDGFRMDGYHTTLTFRNCYARANTAGAGFRINGMVASQFLGCASDVNAFGFVGSNMRSTLFSGCDAEGNTQDGWYLFADNTGAPTSNPLFAQECYDVRGVTLICCPGYGNNVGNAGYAGLLRASATGTHSGTGTLNDGSPHLVTVDVYSCDANVAVAGTKAIVTSQASGGQVVVNEDGDNYFPGGRTIGAGTVHNNKAMAGKVCLLQTVAQTVTTATDTLVTFNTTPIKNDLGATVASTSITIPAGVNKVSVSANMAWASNATGYRKMQVLKNGAGATGVPTEDQTANPSTFTIHNVGGCPIDVAPGDTISLRVHQTSGGNLDTLGATPAAWISVEAIG